METNTFEGIRDRVSGFFGTSDEEIEDRMIRRMVDQAAVNAPTATSDLVNSNTDAGVFSRMAASFGIAQQEMFSHGPLMLTIREAAPIVQSFLLMGIYMLLPILLVLSLYSWGPVFIATASILTITFWTYLWTISRWLEDNMMAALYPSTGNYMASSFGSLLSSDMGMKASILNMAIGFLHIGLPLLFSMLVGWAGFKVQGAMGAADQTSGGMDKVGGAAGSAAGRKAMEGARRR